MSEDGKEKKFVGFALPGNLSRKDPDADLSGYVVAWFAYAFVAKARDDQKKPEDMGLSLG